MPWQPLPSLHCQTGNSTAPAVLMQRQDGLKRSTQDPIEQLNGVHDFMGMDVAQILKQLLQVVDACRLVNAAIA